MKKPIVAIALVQTLTADGRRLYTAYSKYGVAVGKWLTADCGHGAHLAYEAVREAGFRISDAAWAFEIIRTQRQLTNVA